MHGPGAAFCADGRRWVSIGLPRSASVVYTALGRRRPSSRRPSRHNERGTMSRIEDIPLANGLMLLVHDHSRRIASDTTTVALEFVLPIPVKADYFDCDDDYRLFLSVFGAEAAFVTRKERTFVTSGEREAMRAFLLDAFRRDTLPYLERADFPARFLRSRLADIRKRPHRYRAAPSSLSTQGSTT